MSGIACAAAAAASSSAVLTLINAQIVSNTSNATTVVVPKPVGTASGDLLVAVMVSRNAPGTASWTQPAGFTEALDVSGGGTVPFGAVAWKVAGGAEGSTYTFTFSSSDILVAALLCFRNAAFDVVGATGTQNKAPQAASVTLSDVGLALAVFASTDPSTTFTTPTGCTPVVTDTDSSAPSLAIFSKAVATGPTPVISSVSSPSSNVCRGLQIGIKKA